MSTRNVICLFVCLCSMHINLQHVYKMSASRMHACFESHKPLVNGCVDDILFNAAPNVQQTLSQFVNISNLCLVDVLLHCSPDFVINRVEIWTVRWSLFRCNKVRCVSRCKLDCLTSTVCWSTVLLKHELIP